MGAEGVCAVSGSVGLGLAEALERAATELREHARAIRPANGDPTQLLEALGPEGGARVLSWLLANEPTDGEELAAAWAEDEEGGIAALRRLDAESLPKPARKILRKVLHRVRSRGVELPAPAPAAHVAKLPPIEDTLTAAFVSPVDPLGTRAVYLVEPHPSGGARMFELMLDAARGIVGLEVYQAGRSQVRRFLRDITHNPRFPSVEAPRASVQALVARAASAQPADRPLPRGFGEWRTQVAAPPESAKTPGELAAEALGAESTPERLRRATELVRARELGPWPPPGELLQELATRLGESAQGTIIVAEPIRRQQVARILDDAAESAYAGAQASRAAACFGEAAYLLWKAGRDEDARAALAAARAFEAGPEAWAPVARAMLEVALAPVLEKLDREVAGDEENSRLVKV
jgi:hypothetical protein